ncbi:hypothetical protein BCR34DRAFT_593565 [Clohesyomyces aquaticus]|uniref:Uncharacterized protein n=1 Tax=Clohesyomyces aquaticus TaxID=1231657 RepID=A0A1Y1YGX4_9PLEO|nr:hypothetical protein BCR34DRAFT_593565 [Clohesyomyces aquaticus]
MDPRAPCQIVRDTLTCIPCCWGNRKLQLPLVIFAAGDTAQAQGADAMETLGAQWQIYLWRTPVLRAQVLVSSLGWHHNAWTSWFWHDVWHGEYRGMDQAAGAPHIFRLHRRPKKGTRSTRKAKFAQEIRVSSSVLQQVALDTAPSSRTGVRARNGCVPRCAPPKRNVRRPEPGDSGTESKFDDY